MNDVLDFLAYFGGLTIGLLLFLCVCLFIGIIIFLLVFRLLFGESLTQVLNRRNPILKEDADEYP